MTCMIAAPMASAEARRWCEFSITSKAYVSQRIDPFWVEILGDRSAHHAWGCTDLDGTCPANAPPDMASIRLQRACCGRGARDDLLDADAEPSRTASRIHGGVVQW